MKLTTLYNHTGKIIIILLFALFATGIGCGDMYLNNILLSNKLFLKSQMARNDSIEAIRKDITLKNLVHPEAVYIDSEKGLTYLTIRNNALSDKALPDLSKREDTTVQIQPITIKHYTDSTGIYKMMIRYMQIDIDSLFQQLQCAKKEITDCRLLTTPIPKNKDTIKIKPQSQFANTYAIGSANNMPLPPLKITGQLGLIHGFYSNNTSLQLIARQYFGHVSTNEFVALPLYTPLPKKKVSFSASLNFDIATFELKRKSK